MRKPQDTQPNDSVARNATPAAVAQVLTATAANALLQRIPRAYHVLTEGLTAKLIKSGRGLFVGHPMRPMIVARRTSTGVSFMEGSFADIETGKEILISRVISGVSESTASGIASSFNRSCEGRAVMLRGVLDQSPFMFAPKLQIAEHHVFHPGFESTMRSLGGRNLFLPIYPLAGEDKQSEVRRFMAEALRAAKADPATFAQLGADFQVAPDIERALADGDCSVMDLLMAVRALHGDYLFLDRHVMPVLSGVSPFHRRLELPRAVQVLSSMSRYSSEPAVSAVEMRKPLSAATLLKQWRFPATEAQARVVGELADQFLARDTRERLLQGDVGAGKTAVIASAAAMMLVQGYSSVICAPTDILATQLAEAVRQHVEAMLGEGSAAKVVRYQSESTQKTKDALLKKQARTPLIIVGTHGAVRAPVLNLGLAVFDEEHRFARDVKMALREAHPLSHLLQVTATPIPRSLAATIYGGALVSVLDQRPAGRMPIESRVVTDDPVGIMLPEILAAVSAGGRVYVVCPAIDSPQMAGAEEWKERLRGLLAADGIEVGVVHGGLSSKSVNQALTAFKSGSTQVLVGSTILAVGVDVPEATLMCVMDPQMLGVAQLHQVRGRVGRGLAASKCLLCPTQPIEQEQREWLDYVAATQDGFALAEFDLKQRGVGSLDGVAQSGGDLDWTWFAKESAIVLDHLESLRAERSRDEVIDYGF